MFWIISGAMLAAAVLIVALPLYRAEKKLSPTSMISIVTVAAVAGFMYSQIGTPNPDLGRMEDVGAFVFSDAELSGCNCCF
jgi:amino acid permease